MTLSEISKSMFNGWSPDHGDPIAAQVYLLQSVTGGSLGYRLRRIILTNFWLYGHQEFEIPHGRLFLAGENASGKSTVLAAAIPLALDGEIRPARLDTFGGRERHIDYYVLGSNDSATPYSFEKRTSYIALEFEWCDDAHPPIAPLSRQAWDDGDREKARFLTIGLSFFGNVNATDKIRTMRFMVTDGSRLDQDIPTVTTDRQGLQHVVDQQRFKQFIGTHGQLYDSQSEYAKAVAQHLFGFTDVQDFQNVINLLLLLRRPNLSSELSFSRVNDYLKQSLRKIPEEIMQRVTSTIEQIDAIQRERERLQEVFDAASRLDRARQELTVARVRQGACEYLITERSHTIAVQALNKDSTTLRLAESDLRSAQETRQRLAEEIEQLQGKIAALEGHEGIHVAQRVAEMRDMVSEQTKQEEHHRQLLSNATQTRLATEQRLQRLNDQQIDDLNQMKGYLGEMLMLARREAQWPLADEILSTAMETMSQPTIQGQVLQSTVVSPIVALNEHIAERLEHLHKIENLYLQLEDAMRSLAQARDTESLAEQEMDIAYRLVQSAQDHARQAQEDLIEQTYSLGQDDRIIRTQPTWHTIVEIIEQSERAASESIESDHGIAHYESLMQTIRQAATKLEQELTQLASQDRHGLQTLHAQMGVLHKELTMLQDRTDAILHMPDIAYASSPDRQQAREILSAQGIQSYSLYTLLNIAPEILPTEAGRVECLLKQMGLLDALVVAPYEQTQAMIILQEEHLSDILLDLAKIPQELPALHSVLIFDQASDAAEGSWEEWINTWLSSTGQQTISEIWQHGLLLGYTAEQAAVGYIGKANRQLQRQRALDELAREQEYVQAQIDTLATEMATLEQRQQQIAQETKELQPVLTAPALLSALAELRPAVARFQSAQTRYTTAHEETQHARQRHRRIADDVEWEADALGPCAANSETVRTAQRALVQMQQQQRTVHHFIQRLADLALDIAQAKTTVEHDVQQERHLSDLVEETHNHLVRKEAELAELTRMIESEDIVTLITRLRDARERREAAVNEQQNSIIRISKGEERCSFLRQRVEEQNATVEAVAAELHLRLSRLLAQVQDYPVPLLERFAVDIAEDAVKAARHVLEDSSDLDGMLGGLEEESNRAYNMLANIFSSESRVLVEYGPDLDVHGQVRFRMEDNSTPVELLVIIGDAITIQQLLLNEQERRLFEEFLLQEVAESLRARMLEAEEWVAHINDVLKQVPLIGERYTLDWKPLSAEESLRLGNHLAQYHHILRKQAALLTQQEVELLMDAFRKEIQGIRERQEVDSTLNFSMALENIVDYREWFHFDVYVMPDGGQKLKLTDRLTGTRSGAERLFSLYVPLFAALAALYRSAAPGAPRLLALDEAFDKASLANTERILHFLVLEGFQWIMTGPRLSGDHHVIPASARYLMLHEKGTEIATSTATFWCHDPDFGNAIGVTDER